MIGVPKPFRRKKQALQKLLALEERAFAKVVAVTVKKVEGEIHGGHLCNQVLAGRAHMHAFLQALEAAVALPVQRDNLSVKNCLASSQGIGKSRYFWIAFSDVNART